MNNPKQFDKLKAKWYKKLEKSGFVDIEQDEDHLKQWYSTRFKVVYDPVLFKAKEDYYRLARQFLHEHPFKSKYERLVWEYHSEGVGRREINNILKSKRFKTYTMKVQKTIEDLTKEMITKKCR